VNRHRRLLMASPVLRATVTVVVLLPVSALVVRWTCAVVCAWKEYLPSREASTCATQGAKGRPRADWRRLIGGIAQASGELAGPFPVTAHRHSALQELAAQREGRRSRSARKPSGPQQKGDLQCCLAIHRDARAQNADAIGQRITDEAAAAHRRRRAGMLCKFAHTRPAHPPPSVDMLEQEHAHQKGN
jgi:hypothetical protein